MCKLAILARERAHLTGLRNELNERLRYFEGQPINKSTITAIETLLAGFLSGERAKGTLSDGWRAEVKKRDGDDRSFDVTFLPPAVKIDVVI